MCSITRWIGKLVFSSLKKSNSKSFLNRIFVGVHLFFKGYYDSADLSNEPNTKNLPVNSNGKSISRLLRLRIAFHEKCNMHTHTYTNTHKL